MQNFTKEEKESVDFAVRHLTAQANNIVYFSKEVRTSDVVIDLMFSKHRVRQEYINEIWDINQEAVINYLSKKLQSVVSLRKEIKYDDRVIKLCMKKLGLAKTMSMFKPEEWGAVFGKIDLVISMLNLTGRGADEWVFNGHFKHFLELSLENNPLEKINKMMMDYSGIFSVQFVKLLLKNSEFKEFFGEIYKGNLQKNDYRQLIREAFLIRKMEELDENATIEKLPRRKNKI